MSNTENSNQIPPKKDATSINPTQPSKPLIKQFQNFFNSFFNQKLELSQESKDESKKPAPKKHPVPTDDVILKESIGIAKQTDLAKLFPELGIETIEQIEQIIIKIVSSVTKAEPVPNVQHNFQIQFKNKDLELAIKIDTSTMNKKQIKISANGELLALLNYHLADLKKHLKKKAISFDEIELEELITATSDTSKEKNVQT